jgi:hypothetical protein
MYHINSYLVGIEPVFLSPECQKISAFLRTCEKKDGTVLLLLSACYCTGTVQWYMVAHQGTGTVPVSYRYRYLFHSVLFRLESVQIRFVNFRVLASRYIYIACMELNFYPFRILDPGFRIPDPRTATKERGEKKLVVKPFFVATNFTKLKIILFFKRWRKRFGPVFQEL